MTGSDEQIHAYLYLLSFRYDRDSGIMIVAWKDNKAVLCASTLGYVEPLKHATRFDRKLKKRIVIDCPYAVHLYNQTMGGVDRSDQNISLYRSNIRGKKWYYPLFLHAIDLAIGNAWLLYKLITKDRKPLDHLHFRLAVAQHFLSSAKALKRIPLVPNMRYENADHLVVYADGQVGRCAKCHSRAGFMCKSCSRFLHPKCFLAFHSK